MWVGGLALFPPLPVLSGGQTGCRRDRKQRVTRWLMFIGAFFLSQEKRLKNDFFTFNGAVLQRHFSMRLDLWVIDSVIGLNCSELNSHPERQKWCVENPFARGSAPPTCP